LSALLSTFLAILTILIPVVLVTALLVNQVIALKDVIQDRLKDGADLSIVPPVWHAIDWIGQHFGFDTRQILQAVSQHADEITRAAAKYSLVFAGNVTNLFVSFAFAIFTAFFLFRDGERVIARIPELLPLELAQSEALLRRTRDVIDGSLYGVLLIALIQGSLGALAFTLLGVPSPVLWGVVMTVASLIPMFGAAGVWVPVALYLLIVGSWGKAIALTLFGALVISSVDNFLRPKLVGDRIRLSELVMFFSVLGGLQVFGVLGIVLGPVLFAVTGSLIGALRDIEVAVRPESLQTDTRRSP
jgi:predicted PurR-regulated permease PerM